MSFSSFEAFFERGSAVAGETATSAFRSYLLEKTSGARMAPQRIAKALNLDEEIVADLLEVAIGADVRLLEDASQIRCPCCDSRIDLAGLRQRLVDSGEATCPDCEHTLDDFESFDIEQRYCLTEVATAESTQWQEQRAARPKLRAVILTALLEELGAVREQLLLGSEVSLTECVTANGGIYYETTFEGQHVDWVLYASFTQATPGEAAAGAVDAILNFDPQVAIFIGIAGGIAEKGVGLGDVIAATEVFDYDSGKDTSDGYIPRTRQLYSSFSLNQLAGFAILENIWRDRIVTPTEGLDLPAPKVCAEPIAAGGKVIAGTESDTYKLVRKTADRAVGVEMEGSGFLGAVQRYQDVERIVIRGVSDLIDNKAESDKTGVRKQAVSNATAFAFEMLHRFRQATPQSPS